MALTPSFSCFVVGFADEFSVVHEIEFVARVELSVTHDAGETLEVVHKVLRSPHHLRRRNALIAPSTFRSKSPITNCIVI